MALEGGLEIQGVFDKGGLESEVREGSMEGRVKTYEEGPVVVSC